ncbi:MAG TPA: ATP-binding cassette domain-containing protein [Polyangiaceae bacterium]|nr:ATP-binding cassette domain-containing protein [Polyangiaceae bacterium]
MPSNDRGVLLNSTNLITSRSVEIGYGGKALLPHFDLSIGRGEFWAVIGRNGSGKTTWLRTVLGLMDPLSGRIEFASGLKLAYLPQRGSAEDLYPVTAYDVVAMGCQRGWSFFGLGRDQRKRAQHALELMDVGNLSERRFSELSEGQRQRVLFARVAAAQADVALLDEPTSALDLVAEREAFELLRRLKEESNTTIIIVSHYVRLVAEYADHAILLDRDTPAVVLGTPEQVFEHPSFRARYGVGLPSRDLAQAPLQAVD